MKDKIIDKAQEELEGIIEEGGNNFAGNDSNSSEEEREEVNVNITVRDKEEKSKSNRSNKNSVIDSSLLNRIPRVGESVFDVSKYPVNDERDVNKASTICGYSLTAIPVMATSLSEDHKRVLINGGDIELKITGSKQTDDGKEIFYDRDAAFLRWKELMGASLEVATEMFNEAKETKEYLEEALKEGNY